MNTYNVVANGKVIPNVTVTVSPTEGDMNKAETMAEQYNANPKKKPVTADKLLPAIQLDNLRRRFAKQGAQDVRYYKAA